MNVGMLVLGVFSRGEAVIARVKGWMGECGREVCWRWRAGRSSDLIGGEKGLVMALEKP